MTRYLITSERTVTETFEEWIEAASEDEARLASRPPRDPVAWDKRPLKILAVHAETEEERYDRLAELFWKETGIQCPGKDHPSGSEIHHHTSMRVRTDTWQEWLAKRDAAAKGTPS